MTGLAMIRDVRDQTPIEAGICGSVETLEKEVEVKADEVLLTRCYTKEIDMHTESI